MAVEQSETTTVPGWVDDLAGEIAEAHFVAAGPGGSVLISPYSDRTRWIDASTMPRLIFGGGEFPVTAYKGAILTRLRHRASTQLVSEPLHGQSMQGAIFIDQPNGTWFRRDDITDATAKLAANSQCCVLGVEALIDQVARLDLSYAAGPWKEVLATLATADVAYPRRPNKPLSLVIPCDLGGSCEVIMVIGREAGMSVHGFRLTRTFSQMKINIEPLTDRPQRYFPVWTYKRAVPMLRVLILPE